jgi:hypothetical protein
MMIAHYADKMKWPLAEEEIISAGNDADDI